jgi:hypothetical protein
LFLVAWQADLPWTYPDTGFPAYPYRRELSETLVFFNLIFAGVLAGSLDGTSAREATDGTAISKDSNRSAGPNGAVKAQVIG